MLRLKGDRILLRDFVTQDREAFCALESDEAMFAYTKGRIDRASAESFQLPLLLEEPLLHPRPSYSLVIEDEEGFSGWAGIDGIEGTDSAQLGWYLRSDRWGRGYATEATRILLGFGFSELHRASMWATADPENLASVRVLDKSGFTNRGLTDPVETWRGLRSRVLFTIDAKQWATRSHNASYGRRTPAPWSPCRALPTGPFRGPNSEVMEPSQVDRPRSWEYYDRRAQEGQRTVRHAAEYWTGLGVETTEAEIEAEGLELRRLLRSLTPATFAEVGAGPGTFTPDLPGRGLALDQSDTALRALLAGTPTVPALRADACRLPFSDRALERVIGTHLYGLLRQPERRSFLAEAHRVADELIVLDAGRPTGVPAEQTQRRTLSDGRHFEIYRRHFDAEELALELGGRPVFAGRFYVLVIA